MKVKPWIFIVGSLLVLILLLIAVSTVQAIPAPTGSISGAVYCDDNRNNLYDPGEELPGVEVTLWDNLDCSWPITDAVRATQDSASNGTYAFSDLPVGPNYGAPACYAVGVDLSDPALGLCNYPVRSDLYDVWLVADHPDFQADLSFQQVWERWVDHQTWGSGMKVTAQTSDTLEVVDSVYIMPWPNVHVPIDGPYLVESWNPAELTLLGVQISEGEVVTHTGTLTWTLAIFPPGPGPQAESTATLTRTFRVEPCTWTETTLQGDLYYEFLGLNATGAIQPEQAPLQQRPVIIAKMPPDLQIGSTYSAEVASGAQAAFTLGYTNTGGYENAVMIRSDFSPEAPFDSSAPSPDRQGPEGAWAEWDVGKLGKNHTGTIDVTVAIEAGLTPSTTMPITSTIHNHVGEVADTTLIQFHVEQPPLSLGDRVWYDTDQDGIQDASEPGVAGIGVSLYGDSACAGDLLASDVTGVDGLYAFADLQPGDYCLQFSDLPTGWIISPQNQGADDTVDSDADPATAQIGNIPLAGDDNQQDMGVYAEGSVGGTVFCDANANGQFDTGEGRAGIAVSLYDDPACQGVGATLLDSQDSATSGAYLFDGLGVGPAAAPLCYWVEVDEGDPSWGDCTIPLTALSYAVALDVDTPDVLDADFGCSEEPVPPTNTPTPTSTPTPGIAAEDPAVVPEATTLLLLGGAASSLAGYASLQIRARRRKSE